MYTNKLLSQSIIRSKICLIHIQNGLLNEWMKRHWENCMPFIHRNVIYIYSKEWTCECHCTQYGSSINTITFISAHPDCRWIEIAVELSFEALPRHMFYIFLYSILGRLFSWMGGGGTNNLSVDTLNAVLNPSIAAKRAPV